MQKTATFFRPGSGRSYSSQHSAAHPKPCSSSLGRCSSGLPWGRQAVKHCTLISELSSSMHSAYRSPIKSRVLMHRPLNKQTLPIMHALTRVSPRSCCHFFLSYFQRMHVISFNLYRAIKVPDQMHKHPSNCIMNILMLKTQWARQCSGTVSERTETQYI